MIKYILYHPKYIMKITIFGSCRQDSLYSNEKYEITKIQNDISFPHYTKEILELILLSKYLSK